jgi:hypothetical protein
LLAKKSAAEAGGEMKLVAKEESATSASCDIVEVKYIEPCRLNARLAIPSMPGPVLVLRHASTSRISGEWQHEDCEVFDGEREVRRIYQVYAFGGNETWFWGVSSR